MFDKVKLFEKSKEVADSALNIINPYRSHTDTVLFVDVDVDYCSSGNMFGVRST